MADDQIKLGADFSKVQDESTKAKTAVKTIGDAAEFAMQDIADMEKQGTAALNKLSSSTDKAKDSQSKFGQAALQTGRIVQDFQAAGIMGIANNLEGLAMAIGGGAGLAGALTIAATAYLALKKPVGDWLATLGEQQNAIPQTTDKLNQFTAAIKSNTEWMEKAAEKGYLTDDELIDYNQRLAENTQLEKDSASAKEAKANAEKLAAIQTKEAAEASKKASDILQDELAGKTDEVIASVTNKMVAKSEELKGAASLWEQVNKDYAQALDGVTDVGQMNAITSAYTKQLDKVKKIQEDIRGRIASDAANLVGDAVLTGNKGAVDQLAKALGSSDLGKIFGEVFQKIEDELQAEAERFDNAQRTAQDARIEKNIKEAADKAKEAQEKINKALMPMSNNPFEGLNTPLDVALAFDDNGRAYDDGLIESTLEDMQLNAGRRDRRKKKEIGQVAQSFGVDLSSNQLTEALMYTQMGVGNGQMEGDAMFTAIQQVIVNQQMLADNQNRNDNRWATARQNAQTVPDLMYFGNGY